MDLYDDFQNNYPKVLRTQMMGPTVILLSEANPPVTADDDPDDLLALEDLPNTNELMAAFSTIDPNLFPDLDVKQQDFEPEELADFIPFDYVDDDDINANDDKIEIKNNLDEEEMDMDHEKEKVEENTATNVTHTDHTDSINTEEGTEMSASPTYVTANEEASNDKSKVVKQATNHL